MIRLSLSVVAALALGVLIGRCASQRPAYVPPTVPTVDSLPSAYWRAEVERLTELLAERDGLVDQLRARIRGLETRAPVVIERVDTVVDVRTVPVIVGAVADRAGRLDLLRAAPADSAGMRRPEIARAIDLSRCDDGWALDGSRVVCDTPRLGHLTAFARLGGAWDPGIAPVGSVGLRWTPYYRATWAVEARATTDGRVEIAGEIGVRLW